MKPIEYMIRPESKMKLDYKTRVKYFNISLKLNNYSNDITGLILIGIFTLIVTSSPISSIDKTNLVLLSMSSIFLIILPITTLILLIAKRYYILPAYENVSICIGRLLSIRKKNEYSTSIQGKEIRNFMYFLITSLDEIKDKRYRIVKSTLKEYKKLLKVDCYNILVYCSADSVRKIQVTLKDIGRVFHKTEYPKLIHILPKFKNSIKSVKELENIPQPQLKTLVEKIKYNMAFERLIQHLDRIIHVAKKLMVFLLIISLIIFIFYNISNPSTSIFSLLRLIRIP